MALEGTRLAHLAYGIDHRAVKAEREAKSISAETTFDQDIAGFRLLELRLLAAFRKGLHSPEGQCVWPGPPSASSSRRPISGYRTRAQSLGQPTQLASRIFAAGRDLLARETGGTMFRLIGIGVSSLSEPGDADFADFIDRRAADAEQAIDRLRQKFGQEAVVKGLTLEADAEDQEE